MDASYITGKQGGSNLCTDINVKHAIRELIILSMRILFSYTHTMDGIHTTQKIKLIPKETYDKDSKVHVSYKSLTIFRSDSFK